MNCPVAFLLLLLSGGGLVSFGFSYKSCDEIDIYIVGGSLINLSLAHLLLMVMRGTYNIELCAKSSVLYCHSTLNICFIIAMIFFYAIQREHCSEFLFLITLFITIFLQSVHLGMGLYLIREVCKRRRRPRSAIINQNINRRATPEPLPSNLITNFPLLSDPTNSLLMEECIICTDKFKRDDLTARLSCGHAYHLQCFVTWRDRSRTCPMCRKSFK